MSIVQRRMTIRVNSLFVVYAIVFIPLVMAAGNKLIL